MAETNLYIVRHGKTMFNTLARVQGWCDTPLLRAGVTAFTMLVWACKTRSLKKLIPAIRVEQSKPCAFF